MTHINALFPSKYLAASDLQNRDVPLVISHIHVEAVGTEQEDRPCLYFQGVAKGIVLNRTNAKRIAKLYGSDTAAWAGKTVILYESETDFGGETVPCIRIRERMEPPAIPHPVAPQSVAPQMAGFGAFTQPTPAPAPSPFGGNGVTLMAPRFGEPGTVSHVGPVGTVVNDPTQTVLGTTTTAKPTKKPAKKTTKR